MIKFIRRGVYRLGFRPPPGHILNSAVLDFHYKMLDLREVYRKSVDFELMIWDSNVNTENQDTSEYPIRHQRKD